MRPPTKVVWLSQRELVASGRTPYAIGIATTLVAGLLPSFSACCIAGIIGAIAAGGNLSRWAAGLALAIVLGAAVPRIAEFALADLARRLRMRMQVNFFARLNAIDGLAVFEQVRFRDRLRMAQQASETAPNTLMDTLTGTTQAALVLITFFGLAASQSLGLAALSLAAALPSGWALNRDVRERFALLWATTPPERRRAFYSSLLTNMQALKEIRIYGLGPLFAGRMDRELDIIVRQQRAQEARSTARSIGAAGLGALGVAAAVWGLAQSDPLPTVQQASVLLASFVGIQASAVTVFDRLGSLREAVDLYGIYLDLMDELPSSSVGHRLGPALTFQTLTLEGVSFRYKDDLPWAVRDLSMQIKRGTSYGLVGANGAGKSTLIKLILRLYEPTSGRILLDDTDIREIPIADYRRMIGAVFQDFMCHDLTLRENIAIGDVYRDPTDEEVLQASTPVGVEGLARSLPRGFNTMLTQQFEAADSGSDPTERAVILSGGQWQRVAIARALMRSNRPLLILDEPTSGMDARAESDLRDTLAARGDNQAVLHVSRRMSTMRACDAIFVLARGVLVEHGSHETLLASGGVYAEFFKLQAKGYQDGAMRSAACSEA